jgi:hypothetical protein
MITTLVNEVIRRRVYEIGCEKCREVLFELWSTIGAKEVWPEIGRLSDIPSSEILQHVMYGKTQDKDNSNERVMPEPCKEYQDDAMRRMWFNRKFTEASSRLLKARIDTGFVSKMSCECPSCRWILGEIRTAGIEGLSDMSEDSCAKERGRAEGFLPSKDLLKEMWMGVKKEVRIDRLKLLGNGVVPQQAAKAYKNLKAKYDVTQL